MAAARENAFYGANGREERTASAFVDHPPVVALDPESPAERGDRAAIVTGPVAAEEKYPSNKNSSEFGGLFWDDAWNSYVEAKTSVGRGEDTYPADVVRVRKSVDRVLTPGERGTMRPVKMNIKTYLQVFGGMATGNEGAVIPSGLYSLLNMHDLFVEEPWPGKRVFEARELLSRFEFLNRRLHLDLRLKYSAQRGIVVPEPVPGDPANSDARPVNVIASAWLPFFLHFYSLPVFGLKLSGGVATQLGAGIQRPRRALGKFIACPHPIARVMAARREDVDRILITMQLTGVEDMAEIEHGNLWLFFVEPKPESRTVGSARFYSSATRAVRIHWDTLVEHDGNPRTPPGRLFYSLDRAVAAETKTYRLSDDAALSFVSMGNAGMYATLVLTPKDTMLLTRSNPDKNVVGINAQLSAFLRTPLVNSLIARVPPDLNTPSELISYEHGRAVSSGYNFENVDARTLGVGIGTITPSACYYMKFPDVGTGVRFDPVPYHMTRVPVAAPAAGPSPTTSTNLAAIVTLQRNLDTLQRNLDETREESELRRRMLIAEEAESATRRQEAIDALAAVAAREAERDTARATLAAAEERAKRLDTAVQNSVAEVNAIRRQLQQAEADRQRMQAERDAAMQTASQPATLDELKRANDELRRLESDHLQVTNALAQLTVAHAADQQQVTDLQANAQQAAATLQQLQTDLMNVRGQVSALTAQDTVLNADLARERARADDETRARAEAEKRETDLIAQLAALQAGTATHSTAADDMEQRARELTTLRNDVREAVDAIAYMRDEITTMTGRLANPTVSPADIQRITQEIARLNATITVMQAVVNDGNAQHAAVMQQFKELREAVDANHMTILAELRSVEATARGTGDTAALVAIRGELATLRASNASVLGKVETIETALSSWPQVTISSPQGTVTFPGVSLGPGATPSVSPGQRPVATPSPQQRPTTPAKTPRTPTPDTSLPGWLRPGKTPTEQSFSTFSMTSPGQTLSSPAQQEVASPPASTTMPQASLRQPTTLPPSAYPPRLGSFSPPRETAKPPPGRMPSEPPPQVPTSLPRLTTPQPPKPLQTETHPLSTPPPRYSSLPPIRETGGPQPGRAKTVPPPKVPTSLPRLTTPDTPQTSPFSPLGVTKSTLETPGLSPIPGSGIGEPVSQSSQTPVPQPDVRSEQEKISRLVQIQKESPLFATPSKLGEEGTAEDADDTDEEKYEEEEAEEEEEEQEITFSKRLGTGVLESPAHLPPAPVPRVATPPPGPASPPRVDTPPPITPPRLESSEIQEEATSLDVTDSALHDEVIFPADALRRGAPTPPPESPKTPPRELTLPRVELEPKPVAVPITQPLPFVAQLSLEGKGIMGEFPSLDFMRHFLAGRGIVVADEAIEQAYEDRLRAGDPTDEAEIEWRSIMQQVVGRVLGWYTREQREKAGLSIRRHPGMLFVALRDAGLVKYAQGFHRAAKALEITASDIRAAIARWYNVEWTGKAKPNPLATMFMMTLVGGAAERETQDVNLSVASPSNVAVAAESILYIPFSSLRDYAPKANALFACTGLLKITKDLLEHRLTRLESGYAMAAAVATDRPFFLDKDPEDNIFGYSVEADIALRYREMWADDDWDADDYRPGAGAETVFAMRADKSRMAKLPLRADVRDASENRLHAEVDMWASAAVEMVPLDLYIAEATRVVYSKASIKRYSEAVFALSQLETHAFHDLMDQASDLTTKARPGEHERAVTFDKFVRIATAGRADVTAMEDTSIVDEMGAPTYADFGEFMQLVHRFDAYKEEAPPAWLPEKVCLMMTLFEGLYLAHALYRLSRANAFRSVLNEDAVKEAHVYYKALIGHTVIQDMPQQTATSADYRLFETAIRVCANELLKIHELSRVELPVKPIDIASVIHAWVEMAKVGAPTIEGSSGEESSLAELSESMTSLPPAMTSRGESQLLTPIDETDPQAPVPLPESLEGTVLPLAEKEADVSKHVEAEAFSIIEALSEDDSAELEREFLELVGKSVPPSVVVVKTPAPRRVSKSPAREAEASTSSHVHTESVAVQEPADPLVRLFNATCDGFDRFMHSLTVAMPLMLEDLASRERAARLADGGATVAGEQQGVGDNVYKLHSYDYLVERYMFVLEDYLPWATSGKELQLRSFASKSTLYATTPNTYSRRLAREWPAWRELEAGPSSGRSPLEEATALYTEEHGRAGKQFVLLKPYRTGRDVLTGPERTALQAMQAAGVFATGADTQRSTDYIARLAAFTQAAADRDMVRDDAIRAAATCLVRLDGGLRIIGKLITVTHYGMDVWNLGRSPLRGGTIDLSFDLIIRALSDLATYEEQTTSRLEVFAVCADKIINMVNEELRFMRTEMFTGRPATIDKPAKDRRDFIGLTSLTCPRFMNYLVPDRNAPPHVLMEHWSNFATAWIDGMHDMAVAHERAYYVFMLLQNAVVADNFARRAGVPLTHATTISDRIPGIIMSRAVDTRGLSAEAQAGMCIRDLFLLSLRYYLDEYIPTDDIKDFMLPRTTFFLETLVSDGNDVPAERATTIFSNVRMVRDARVNVTFQFLLVDMEAIANTTQQYFADLYLTVVQALYAKFVVTRAEGYDVATRSVDGRPLDDVIRENHPAAADLSASFVESVLAQAPWIPDVWFDLQGLVATFGRDPAPATETEHPVVAVEPATRDVAVEAVNSADMAANAWVNVITTREFRSTVTTWSTQGSRATRGTLTRAPRSRLPEPVTRESKIVDDAAKVAVAAALDLKNAIAHTTAQAASDNVDMRVLAMLTHRTCLIVRGAGYSLPAKDAVFGVWGVLARKLNATGGKRVRAPTPTDLSKAVFSFAQAVSTRKFPARSFVAVMREFARVMLNEVARTYVVDNLPAKVSVWVSSVAHLNQMLMRMITLAEDDTADRPMFAGVRTQAQVPPEVRTRLRGELTKIFGEKGAARTSALQQMRLDVRANAEAFLHGKDVLAYVNPLTDLHVAKSMTKDQWNAIAQYVRLISEQVDTAVGVAARDRVTTHALVEAWSSQDKLPLKHAFMAMSEAATGKRDPALASQMFVLRMLLAAIEPPMDSFNHLTNISTSWMERTHIVSQRADDSAVQFRPHVLGAATRLTKRYYGWPRWTSSMPVVGVNGNVVDMFMLSAANSAGVREEVTVPPENVEVGDAPGGVTTFAQRLQNAETKYARLVLRSPLQAWNKLLIEKVTWEDEMAPYVFMRTAMDFMSIVNTAHASELPASGVNRRIRALVEENPYKRGVGPMTEEQTANMGKLLLEQLVRFHEEPPAETETWPGFEDGTSTHSLHEAVEALAAHSVVFEGANNLWTFLDAQTVIEKFEIRANSIITHAANSLKEFNETRRRINSFIWDLAAHYRINGGNALLVRLSAMARGTDAMWGASGAVSSTRYQLLADILDGNEDGNERLTTYKSIAGHISFVIACSPGFLADIIASPDDNNLVEEVRDVWKSAVSRMRDAMAAGVLPINDYSDVSPSNVQWVLEGIITTMALANNPTANYRPLQNKWFSRLQAFTKRITEKTRHAQASKGQFEDDNAGTFEFGVSSMRAGAKAVMADDEEINAEIARIMSGGSVGDRVPQMRAGKSVSFAANVRGSAQRGAGLTNAKAGWFPGQQVKFAKRNPDAYFW